MIDRRSFLRFMGAIGAVAIIEPDAAARKVLASAPPEPGLWLSDEWLGIIHGGRLSWNDSKGRAERRFPCARVSVLCPTRKTDRVQEVLTNATDKPLGSWTFNLPDRLWRMDGPLEQWRLLEEMPDRDHTQFALTIGIPGRKVT